MIYNAKENLCTCVNIDGEYFLKRASRGPPSLSGWGPEGDFKKVLYIYIYSNFRMGVYYAAQSWDWNGNTAKAGIEWEY